MTADITQQTIGEPLANPWYTPGWTAQNPIYTVIAKNMFNLAGFPANPIFITVTANFFDGDGNPIAGNLTFWPSSALTLTDPVSGTTTIVPQRFVGQDLWDQPGVFLGSGKVHLKNGNLLVSLLATDNTGVSMVPASFTYHVKETFYEGREYDITVPSASVSPVDINSLIIPGSLVIPGSSSLILIPGVTVRIAAVSTQFLPVNISNSIGGTSFNPTLDEVDFAFIAGSTEPQAGDWHVGSWIAGGPPYMAQLLIGPGTGGLVLAKGTYNVWNRVIATPQIPVFPTGTLVIY